MSRFDYVKYDTVAIAQQELAKKACQEMEGIIDGCLEGRPRDLAHNALEVCYMWCGKGIRDGQIKRNGSAPLQEERNDE